MICQRVKAWLMLFRAHTIILETPIAVLGAALALGTLWNIQVLWWIPFGLMYHLVGYGMNSYTDWIKGFDKEDTRKQHLPLNTGEIHPETAKKVVYLLLMVFIIYGEVIGGLTLTAHLCIGVLVVSGILYNYIGKYTVHKYIPISLAHTMVFVYPFLMYSEINTAFLLLATAFFVHHVFQIGISGDVKDIDQDESSLIRQMGAKIENKIFNPSAPVLILGFGLVAIEILLGGSALGLLEPNLIHIILFIAFAIWSIYESNNVIGKGQYNRSKRVISMSRKELSSFWMLYAAMLPVIGVFGFVVVTGISLLYLFAMSRFLWGNWVKPNV